MHYANANASAIKVKFGSHGAWKLTKRGENLVSCDRFTIRGNRCSEHYFLARNYREKYGIVRLIEEFERTWRNSSTYFIFKKRKDLASLFFNNFLNVQRIIENEISLTISYIRVIPVLNSIINYVRVWIINFGNCRVIGTIILKEPAFVPFDKREIMGGLIGPNERRINRVSILSLFL